MLLGVIADDFTGASDIANALAQGHGAEGGLRVIQYLGIPDMEADAGTEAAVISLKTRSIPASDAVAQSLAALAWLQAQGCRQIVFKYCSTFDSTPDGNIGPVGEALARKLDAKGVIVCPVFPRAKRTLYKGHLFVGGRLLNESGMEHHPLNPMTDPDLRRWLARQCEDAVGLVDWDVVRQGAEAIRTSLAESAGRGERLVIVDAIADEDLLAICAACADAPMLTGGSGIALGLPANFRKAGLVTGKTQPVAAVGGPGAVLVGSCSGATLRQIEIHGRNHPTLAVDGEAVMAGTVTADTLAEFIQANASKAPLVYSSGTPEDVARLQAAHGAMAVSAKLEGLFGTVARRLYDSGIRRIVVGGGETSGAIVKALGVRSFEIGPEIDPGVPVLIANDGTGLGMALKSGNFGAEDFFAKALAAIAGETAAGVAG